MDRKKVLEFLKNKKTLEDISKEFGEIENLEQEIFKWVDDSYIRLIEDGNEVFFETVNNEFTKKKVREIAQLSIFIRY